MDVDGLEAAPQGGTTPTENTGRVGRRVAIKAGIAATTGLVLGVTYAPPTIGSAAIPTAYAISGGIKPPEATEKPEPKPGKKPGGGKKK